MHACIHTYINAYIHPLSPLQYSLMQSMAMVHRFNALSGSAQQLLEFPLCQRLDASHAGFADWMQPCSESAEGSGHTRWRTRTCSLETAQALAGISAAMIAEDQGASPFQAMTTSLRALLWHQPGNDGTRAFCSHEPLLALPCVGVPTATSAYPFWLLSLRLR